MVSASVHELLLQSYERIERSCSHWRHGAVKAAVQRSRNALAQQRPTPTPVSSAELEAVMVAFAAGTSSVVEAALHSLNELVLANAFAEAGSERAATTVITIDEMLQTVLVDAPGGGGVRMLAVKLALTASTGTSIRMCLDSHVLCMKTCFDVYALADSVIQRTASTAALTQIYTQMLTTIETVTEDAFNKGFVLELDRELIPVEELRRVPVKGVSVTLRRGSGSVGGSDGNDGEDDVASMARQIVLGLAEGVLDGRLAEEHKEMMEMRDHIADIRRIVLVGLRILLRLSMRRIPSYSDNPDLRRQTLARDMLILVLRNSGPAFRRTASFIDTVKEYLEGAFISHCFSPAPEHFRLALTVLSACACSFSERLSHSLCLVLNHIATVIVESSLGSEKHVIVFLELLAYIAARPTVLANIFVPLNGADYQARLFSNLFHMLQAIVDTSVASDWSHRGAVSASLVQSVRVVGMFASCLLQWLQIVIDAEREQLHLEAAESDDISSSAAPQQPPVDNGVGVGLHLLSRAPSSSPSSLSAVSRPSPSSQTSVKRQFSVRDGSSLFVSVAEAKTALRALLEAGWAPALAALSLVAEYLDPQKQPETWTRCIDAYKHYILLSLYANVPLARQAFVQALLNCAHLSVPSGNVSSTDFSLRTSQLYAIETLLDLALKDGEKLEESWDAVLHLLSQLEHVKPALDTVLWEHVESIYASAVEMYGETLRCFANSLCVVSRYELFQRRPAWMYALPRLSRLLLLSLHRDRDILRPLWRKANAHMVEASTHPNHTVAKFVIDAIGEVLDMVFSAKAPSKMKTLQHEFVDTLVSIMGSQHEPEIWLLIVSKVSELVARHSDSIQSGWQGIIVVFTLAAREDTNKTVDAIVNSLLFVSVQHLASVEEYLSDFITVLDMLRHSPKPRHRHAALRCLTLVAHHSLQHVKVVDRSASPSSASRALSRTHRAQEHLSVVLQSVMASVSSGLSLGSDSSAVLQALQECIERHMHEFGAAVATAVVQQILQVPTALSSPAGSELEVAEHLQCLASLLERSLHSSVDMFLQFYPANAPRLPELLHIFSQLLLLPATQSPEQCWEGAESAGIACLRRLLESISLSSSDLSIVFSSVSRLLSMLSDVLQECSSTLPERRRTSANIVESVLELVLDVFPSMAIEASGSDVRALMFATRNLEKLAARLNDESTEADLELYGIESLSVRVLSAMCVGLRSTAKDALATELFLEQYAIQSAFYQQACDKYPPQQRQCVERAAYLALLVGEVRSFSSASFWEEFSRLYGSGLFALVESEHLDLRRQLYELFCCLVSTDSSSRAPAAEKPSAPVARSSVSN